MSRFVSILAILGAMAGLVLMGARLFFVEDVSAERGTASFYFYVPSITRAIPTPGLVGDASYYATMGDGAKPPMSAVDFRTSDDPDAVVEVILAYFRQEGFAESAEGKLERPGEYLEIVRHGDRLQVTVVERVE